MAAACSLFDGLAGTAAAAAAAACVKRMQGLLHLQS
jgi:hypothetical protein